MSAAKMGGKHLLRLTCNIKQLFTQIRNIDQSRQQWTGKHHQSQSNVQNGLLVRWTNSNSQSLHDHSNDGLITFVQGTMQSNSNAKTRSSNSEMEKMRKARDLYTDYTLVCGSQTFEVHRIVLHMRSTTFAAAFAGPFKEGQDSVARGDRRMAVNSTEPEAVQAMLDWFYVGSYEPPEAASKLVFHLKLYELGDYYGAPELMEASLAEFDMECRRDEWWTADLAQAVRFIEDENKKGMVGHERLRNILLATMRSKLARLVHSDEFADLMSEFKELNVVLLMTMAADASLRHPPAQAAMPYPTWGVQDQFADFTQSRGNLHGRGSAVGGGSTRGGGRGRGALTGGGDGGLGMP